MKKLRCPLCESENITNRRNGQDQDPSEITEEDELYIGFAGNGDWFDGPVDQMICENGHVFYVPHPDGDPQLRYDYEAWL